MCTYFGKYSLYVYTNIPLSLHLWFPMATMSITIRSIKRCSLFCRYCSTEGDRCHEGDKEPGKDGSS